MRWSRETAFDEAFVREILGLLSERLPRDPPREIRVTGAYSNDLAEVWYPDGRTLVVKRARYPNMASRLYTDHEAARLLRERVDVLAPDCDVIVDPYDEPILVYWWIPNPTLEELWPELSESQREGALRDAGRLIRRIHQVRLSSHGALPAEQGREQSLAAFLRSDLEDRLRPEVRAAWPAGLPLLDRLIAAIPAAESASDGAVLVHNDLYSANLICDREDGAVRCVGVLDLEEAFAGPPEADLARAELLHGPLFGRPLRDGWFDAVLEGYGDAPDSLLLGFFRVYHLLNMGYHAVVTGLGAHAEQVARAAERELEEMGSGRSHQEVVAM